MRMIPYTFSEAPHPSARSRARMYWKHHQSRQHQSLNLYQRQVLSMCPLNLSSLFQSIVSLRRNQLVPCQDCGRFLSPRHRRLMLQSFTNHRRGSSTNCWTMTRITGLRVWGASLAPPRHNLHMRLTMSILPALHDTRHVNPIGLNLTLRSYKAHQLAHHHSHHHPCAYHTRKSNGLSRSSHQPLSPRQRFRRNGCRRCSRAR